MKVEKKNLMKCFWHWECRYHCIRKGGKLKILKVTENHKITLFEKLNPHILVTGKSGYGKTFFVSNILIKKFIQEKEF